MNYSATMKTLLGALAALHGSGWRTFQEVRSLYREHSDHPVSDRTLHRNLAALVKLGWVDTDSPMRTLGRRYRVTDNGRAARLRYDYGDPIDTEGLRHEHSFGRPCVRCENNKRQAS